MRPLASNPYWAGCAGVLAPISHRVRLQIVGDVGQGGCIAVATNRPMEVKGWGNGSRLNRDEDRGLAQVVTFSVS